MLLLLVAGSISAISASFTPYLISQRRHLKYLPVAQAPLLVSQGIGHAYNIKILLQESIFFP